MRENCCVCCPPRAQLMDVRINIGTWPSQTKWTTDTVTRTARALRDEITHFLGRRSLASFSHLSTKAQQEKAVEMCSSRRNPWQNTSPLSPLWLTSRAHAHTHTSDLFLPATRNVLNAGRLSAFSFTSHSFTPHSQSGTLSNTVGDGKLPCLMCAGYLWLLL